MRIFGLDIVSVKKQDIKEAQRFENIVSALSNTLSDMLDFVDNMDVTDMNDFYHLAHGVSVIKGLLLSYEDNKFSRPCCTIPMIQAVQSLDKVVLSFNKKVVYYNQINIHVCNARSQVSSMSEEYDDYETDYDEILSNKMEEVNIKMNEWKKALSLQKQAVTKSLVELLNVIHYDVFRIASGVDIIRSHKMLKKNFPNGKATFEVKIMHEHPKSKEERIDKK